MTLDKREELLAKAKPIFFVTDMVRAILGGRKTVTRRVLKPYNSIRAKRSGYYQGNGLWCDKDITYIKDYSVSCCWIETKTYIKEYAPYKAGATLYVRETWCHEDSKYHYRADGEEIEILGINGVKFWFGKADGLKWHPSIHMPKEAARIFLRVTNVRVERLQDITEE